MTFDKWWSENGTRNGYDHNVAKEAWDAAMKSRLPEGRDTVIEECATVLDRIKTAGGAGYILMMAAQQLRSMKDGAPQSQE